MNKNNKIVIIAGYTPSLVNFRLHLLIEFKKLYRNVITRAPEEHIPTIKKLESNHIGFRQINLNATGMNPFKELFSFFKLYLFIKEEEPDAVFLYTIKPVIYGSLVAWLANVKNIYSLITGLGFSASKTTLSTKQRIANYISYLLYKLALKKNSTIFFQNQDDLNEFITNKIIKSDFKTIIVNGSGVDLKHFSFKPIPTNSNFVFLLIARLIKDKGIFEYYEAAKAFIKLYPNVSFNILGYFYNSPNALTKKQLDKWVSEGVINYLGASSDVRPYIENSSVFVLPSYREGTPRSVLEAMAMGRPIITTNVPGCKETVIDGYNGFLVEAHNPKALLAAMIKLYSDSNLVKNMGINSRKLAEKKYNVHDINAKIIRHISLNESYIK